MADYSGVGYTDFYPPKPTGRGEPTFEERYNEALRIVRDLTLEAAEYKRLLMRCDSLISLIRYRENDGLSEQSTWEADQLIAEIRKVWAQ